MAPYLGEISVIKTAAPIAKGVAIIADKIVTIKEPKIIGKAPSNGLPSAPLTFGCHSVPNKNLRGLILFTKKVDNPFWATKIRIIATIITIKIKQKSVIIFPNFSKREFLEGDVSFLASS